MALDRSNNNNDTSIDNADLSNPDLSNPQFLGNGAFGTVTKYNVSGDTQKFLIDHEICPPVENENAISTVAVKRLQRTDDNSKAAFKKEREIGNQIRIIAIKEKIETINLTLAPDDNEDILYSRIEASGSCVSALPRTAEYYRRTNDTEHNMLKFLLRFIRNIYQAKEALHQHNIVHMDISARNILVNKLGLAILADFGLALYLGDRKEVEIPSGNLPYRYMPLQSFITRKTTNASKEVDDFAFKVTLLEMITYASELGEASLWRIQIDDDELLAKYNLKNGDVPSIETSIRLRWDGLTDFEYLHSMIKNLGAERIKANAIQEIESSDINAAEKKVALAKIEEKYPNPVQLPPDMYLCMYYFTPFILNTDAEKSDELFNKAVNQILEKYFSEVEQATPQETVAEQQNDKIEVVSAQQNNETLAYEQTDRTVVEQQDNGANENATMATLGEELQIRNDSTGNQNHREYAEYADTPNDQNPEFIEEVDIQTTNHSQYADTPSEPDHPDHQQLLDFIDIIKDNLPANYQKYLELNRDGAEFSFTNKITYPRTKDLQALFKLQAAILTNLQDTRNGNVSLESAFEKFLSHFEQAIQSSEKSQAFNFFQPSGLAISLSKGLSIVKEEMNLQNNNNNSSNSFEN